MKITITTDETVGVRALGYVPKIVERLRIGDVLQSCFTLDGFAFLCKANGGEKYSIRISELKK